MNSPTPGPDDLTFDSARAAHLEAEEFDVGADGPGVRDSDVSSPGGRGDASSPRGRGHATTTCDDVRAEFVNLWGRMGGFWGVPPTTARVYGFLLSLDHAASSDEIITGLAMSRGAVSMACRELRDWGLIHSEHEPGSRQVRYRPETDLEKAIRNIVAARKRREWDPILEHLREWIPRLEAENSPEAAQFRERLQSIESLVGAADAMAESFLQGGLVKSLGLKMLVASARASAAKKRGAKRRGP